MESDHQESSFVDDLSEDEADWEEVAVPGVASAASTDEVAPHAPVYEPYAHLSSKELSKAAPSESNIEITIQSKESDEENRPKGISHAERLMRIDCHKTHTVSLLASACVRNRWLNDELLHARLMSLTPLSLQNGFAMITKARVPEAGKRGRLFETALQRLVEWWDEFFEVIPEGHLKSRTFDEVSAELKAKEERRILHDEAKRRNKKGKQKAEETDHDEEDADGEVLHSAKSLMKHALMQEGSRDVSALLFTALCRALGIPSRLVVSLQSVPWQTGIGKPKTSTTKKPKASNGLGPTVPEGETRSRAPTPDLKGSKSAFPVGGHRLDGGTTSSPIKTPPPRVIKLRKSKPAGQTLGSSSSRSLKPPDPLTTPPVFWTEVFSRPDGRWMPVDPLRGIVNKRKEFDPAAKPQTGPGRRFKQENRMVYVVAIEQDGYGRDVTPRYAKDYGAKVAKLQGAERGGAAKGRREWWERVCNMILRPYRLHRDDVEDEELQENQLTEAMPTTITGFKDHPLYALERHVKRDEIIYPRKEIGKFRGEPVYPRAYVLPVKSAEGWMRVGRKVREGCQPMKQVKQRAATVNRQREIELAMADGGEAVMQGMYALNQTELFRPDPVVNGKIPRNDFGNIDLYVPSMLPEGAVHLPYKGIAKIARKLGFDYAEAVTGFEFRKKKANAVITGIVIAMENEEAALEAYWEAEHDAAEREREKKYERVMKRWIRLVQGLRIRQRLQAQYAGDMPKEVTVSVTVEAEESAQGGFMTAADDVVQAYRLPKYQHLQLQPLAGPSNSEPAHSEPSPVKSAVSDLADSSRRLTLEVIEDGDGDEDMEQVAPTAVSLTEDMPLREPKTMRELAADAARARASRTSSDSEVEVLDSPPRKPGRGSGRNARTTNSANSVRGKMTRTRSSAPRPASNDIIADTQPTASRRSTRQTARKRMREEEDDPSESFEADAEASDARPPRTRRGAAAPAVSEKRVLRPRKRKTAAQLEEEDEMEEAYRQAAEDSDE